MRKKLFTFFVIALCCAGSSYAEAIYGEKCGENVDWVFYDGSGYLYLSGSGDMYNYYSSNKVPWYNYIDQITNVVFESGSSITSIGSDAFRNCSSLTSVTFPNSVTSIGDYAFCNCRILTSITIPNSVTSIGDGAFGFCSSLTSVTIPNSVISIGYGAFTDCSSLTSVTIPNSVTSIGRLAFNDVLNIVYTGTATGSPWGARSINGYVDGYLVYSDASKTTLLACSAAAKEIVIPNSVTSIGDNAFNNCSSLTSVTIPNSVTSIGSFAFYGCNSLTSPIYIAHVFAFMPQSYSGAYVIPDGIESIAGGAFCNCHNLTSVTIGNSVTSIGDYAFYGCSGLTQITTLAQTPPEATYNSFEGVDLTIPVYVPAGTLSAYKAATGWSKFTNIQEKNTEGVEDIRIQPSTTASQKILHDGILYILRPDGKVYNAQGTEL